MVPAQRRDELPLWDRPGRRVEQRDEQVSVLAREGGERRRHRIGRGGELALGRFTHVLVAGVQARDQPPDPLRREVAVCDDLGAAEPDRVADAVRQLGRLGVAEQDQGLLGDVEVARIDHHLGGRREALGSAFTVQPSQRGAQRRRARGPDQPVAVVE